MEDNKKYVISLDSNTDINDLPLETLLDANNSGTVPIWSVASRNKKSEEFYEFELVAKEENSIVSVCEENSSTDLCYICDTSVPKVFIQNHYTSEKHRTCVAIMRNALDRATKHAQSVPFIHTGSASKSVSLSEDVLYFCDHCSSAVEVKNKNTHEKTKEHQVSVIHDRLLNGLLITYLDKSKVADSRYEAKAWSDDSTRENDANDNSDGSSKVDNSDSMHKDVYSGKDKQCETEQDSDDGLTYKVFNMLCEELIEFYDENSRSVTSKYTTNPVEDNHRKANDQTNEENDDVANATYLMLCEEITELCDENSVILSSKSVANKVEDNQDTVASNDQHSLSSKSITNQVKDNLRDAVASNDQGTVEILTVGGLTFQFPTNNYHGFVNTWRAWGEDGNFDCLLCEQLCVETETHKEEPRHIEFITKPVQNNCLRQINDVWHHCIICNQMLQNVKLHISSQLHKNNHYPLELKEKLQKRAQKMYYCDVCKCEISVTNKDDLLNGVKHVKLTHYDLRYHIKKFRGESMCIICNIVVRGNDIDKHIKSNAHNHSYKKFLVENKITRLRRCFKCHACKSRLTNAFEIDHVQNEIHKNNLSVYKSIPSLPLNNNSIKDIDFFDEANAPLLHFFESTDNVNHVRCRICKKNIISKSARIKKHIKKQYHQFNLQALLLVNKMKNRLDGTYFCEICRSIVKEIDHVNSDKHERNMKNVPLSQKDSNTSSAAFSSSDNPASNVFVSDDNTEQKLSMKPIDTVKEPKKFVNETSKPRESFKFKQLLQMNNLRSSEVGEQYFCDLCAEQVASKDLTEHIQHENHLEKLIENLNEQDKNISQCYCEACQIYIPDIYYIKDVHIRSEQHLLNFKSLKGEKQVNAASNDVDYMFEPTDKRLSVKCKICQHILKAKKIKRHIESSKHMKALILICTKNRLKLQFNGKYLCEFCNDNSVEVEKMLNHIVSEKHKKCVKGTDSNNFYAAKAKPSTEKEIITTGKNERNVSETTHSNGNSELTRNTKNNFSSHKDKTLSFASMVNTKATEEDATKSSKRKTKVSGSAKLLSHEINNTSDNGDVSVQVSNTAMNTDLNKLCNKTSNDFLVEVSSKPTEVMCKLCKTFVPKTESNMQDHLKGKRHSLNYDKFVSENVQGEVQNKLKTVLDESSRDKNTTKKNAAKQVLSDTNENAVILQDALFKAIEGKLFCRCCNTEVSSAQHDISTHVNGWRHKVKLSAMLAENGLRVSNNSIYCNVCDVYLANLKGITHIDSSVHKTKALAKTIDSTADICKPNT